MTKAGADIIVCHMGLTMGAIGAERADADDCVARINDWAEAARARART
jgi:predicted TIM-barrel enzyme